MRISLILGTLILTGMVFFFTIRLMSETDSLQISTTGVVESDFEAERVDFAQQIEELTAKVSNLEAEKRDQSTRLEATSTGRDQLTSDIEQAAQRLTEAQTENADLAKKNVELTDALGALKSTASTLDSAFSESEITIQTLGVDLVQAREQVQTLQAKTTQLERENVDYATRITDLKNNAVSSQKTLDDKIVDLTARVDQKAEALKIADARMAALMQGASGQEQVTSDMLGQITDFEGRVATLTGEVVDLSDAVARRDSIIESLMAASQTRQISPVASCQERSDAVFGGTQVRFDDGSPTISADAIPLLEQLATIAIECVQENLSLEIEGHTDSAGGDASNLLLSNGRAKAVQSFLETLGVPAKAMRAVGYGESNPVADNDTPEGQAQNRRIVFDWEQS